MQWPALISFILLGVVGPASASPNGFEVAKLAEADHDYAGAAAQFIAFATQNPAHPKSAEALNHGAKLSALVGQHEAAAEAYLRSLNRYPRHTDAVATRLAAARSFEEAGDARTARRLWKQAVEVGPKLPALADWIDAEITRGEPDRVEALSAQFERACRRSTKSLCNAPERHSWVTEAQVVAFDRAPIPDRVGITWTRDTFKRTAAMEADLKRQFDTETLEAFGCKHWVCRKKAMTWLQGHALWAITRRALRDKFEALASRWPRLGTDSVSSDCDDASLTDQVWWARTGLFPRLRQVRHPRLGRRVLNQLRPRSFDLRPRIRHHQLLTAPFPGPPTVIEQPPAGSPPARPTALKLHRAATQLIHVARPELLATLYARSIALDPQNAAAHYNLGCLAWRRENRVTAKRFFDAADALHGQGLPTPSRRALQGPASCRILGRDAQ